jgi:cathepsin L
MKVFLDNMDMIKTHNSNPQNTYKMGLNKFSAMTKEEFASTYLTIKPGTFKDA